MSKLSKIEKQYGERPKIPMGHGQRLVEHHFRAELDNGQTFVYCPEGFICSWLFEDYLNKWCPWCKKFYEEGIEDE